MSAKIGAYKKNFGLAVLMLRWQEHQRPWEPVAFSCRGLIEADR
jgi:hypothetical protein